MDIRDESVDYVLHDGAYMMIAAFYISRYIQKLFQPFLLLIDYIFTGHEPFEESLRH